jgi:hypothetical protein
MYACQAFTFGNVKATGTVAPKTALALSRCNPPNVYENLEASYPGSLDRVRERA